MQKVAQGVVRVPTGFANVYFIGEPDGRWAVVDAGLPGYTARIVEKAERRFGPKSRPVAIFLTHGHVDHTGCAQALADYWGVPIYAHRLEMPYLTGRSGYPPADPTVGGAIGLLIRLAPATAQDFGSRMRGFTADSTGADPAGEGGDLPEMDGWRWLHVPGHAPGQVAFYRAADRTLLAGDAVATVDMDSFIALFTQRQCIAVAGAPMTCDWELAARSVGRLAGLRPRLLACGHGVPLAGENLATALQIFARNFAPPAHGRYVREPARTDERGVDTLPPKPADPLPWMVLAALVGLGLAWGLSPRRRS